MVAEGKPKFGWFNELNSSQRNWSADCSRIAKFLNSAKSRFSRPGPINRLRPAFPFTKEGASANAETSNQRLMLRSLRLPLPMRLGRLRHPHPARSPAPPPLKGEPDCKVRMPEI